MLEARVAPTIVSFNALASAHSSKGDLSAVERVLERATAARLPLDRFSYGALLQASMNAKGAAKLPARERAKQHVHALLHSGVELNDYLRTMCKRAIGESALTALLDSRSTRSGGRMLQLKLLDATTDATTDAPELGMRSSGPARGGRPSASAQNARRGPGRGRSREIADEEGWTTTRRARSTAHEPPSTSAAGIKKRNPQPPPKTPTATPKTAAAAGLTASPSAAPSAAAAAKASWGSGEVRLSGVPMTRSKSERSRLIAIAQGAVLASGDAPPSPAATVVGQRTSSNR